MLIGEVAKRTGASLKAIRLYESLGLLGRVRRKGSYRVYSEENVRQIRIANSTR
jgi:MerR family transcriptional regulator, copper efflux regulator